MSNQSIEVFFDGDCPLCRREIEFLQRRDKANRILATDIAASGFQAPEGYSFAILMDRIHGRLPGGEVIEGVEVFRQLYDAAGFGGLVRLSHLSGIRQFLEFGYKQFARHRLSLTGRRKCRSGTCGLPRAS